jgi:hypothetical protein
MSGTWPDTAAVLRDCAAYWRGERTGPRLSLLSEPTYRQMLDESRANLDGVADAAAACIRADIEAGEPAVLPAIYADFGTISTARLYGGRVIPPHDGSKIHIAPAIHGVDELGMLRPAPFEESDFQVALELHRKVCDRVGTDAVYMRTPDFQGPLNTLALVMDQQELLVGMYEEPEAVHAGLEAVTTTLIDYHRRFRRELGGGKVIGSIWPYTILPEEMGASLTQDMLPLLSAELYRDFELPCLGRIAEAFGGVQIHCCGRYGQHLPALKASGIRIRGLEFHHPFTPFAEVHRVFGDGIVYIPYLFGECHDYPDFTAFAADLLRQGTPQTRFWFAMIRGWVDADALKRLCKREEPSR